MKAFLTLLVLLLCGALVSRAQAPDTLQTYQFSGYNYPGYGNPTEPGSTLVNYENYYYITIGGTDIQGVDYAYDNGDDGGPNYQSDGTFAAIFPFPSGNYTSSVEEYTQWVYCTACNYNGGLSLDYSGSAANNFSWDFSNDPLGQLISYNDPGGAFYVQYMLHIPRPTLNSSAGSGNTCAGTPVTLSVNINWPNLSGLTYLFEYLVPGSSTWQTLDRTSSSSVTLSNYPTLINYLNQQTSSTTVSFRVSIIAANQTTNYGVQSVSFAPGAPIIGGVSSTLACPGGGGSITVSGVTGSGNYKYTIQTGLNNDAPCNPPSCTPAYSGSFSGSSSGTSYTIPDVAAGDYTLWVANSGGSSGACYTTQNVTVTGAAALAVSSTSYTNVTCAGGSDGSITVQTTGGQSVEYQLVDQTTGVSGSLQATGNFTGLAAGTYKVNVTDGCGETRAPTFVIIQPTQVTGSFTETDATCNNPGNGSLTVNVSQGSGTYNYYLYLGGSLVSSQLNSTYTNWDVDNLGGGSYSLQVVDAAASSCSGYAVTVTIGAPATLGVSVTQVTEPACNGALTGAVVLQGSGGGGGYNFTLQDATIGYSGSNTTGSFASLPAGSYTAIVQSTVTGCSDSYTDPSPVVVSQPAAIGIVLTPANVSCYGLQNGAITTVLSGGTGTLVPAWQQVNGGPMSGAGADLSGLSPGTYVLTVTDGNGCSETSGPETITQPGLLAIPSVAMTDIVCYGGAGTITPAATGGNGGNVFSYSADGGATYAAFSPGASFPAGSYLVEVMDSKGCTATYATPQVVTAPSSALAFTDELSQYNGYNVGCYGATNGSVTVSATGGNGAEYNGYTYSIDGGNWQASAILSGLTAGAHTIRVTDNRGCVVTHTETLIQPANQLSQALESQQNNVCADGGAGMLVVSASGGTAPYTFSQDGVSFQSAGTFSGLTSGNYIITAMDQNGCRLSADYSVLSLYPAITVTPLVQAVGCNGGSDGSISVAVTGGYGSYSYQWEILADSIGNRGVAVSGAAGSSATALAAGSYAVTVTDEKGCTMADTTVVGQPAALQALLTTVPVCTNSTGGQVSIAVSGGTPPYRYSPDGGTTQQPDSSFTGLAAGSYTIGVTDSHGCSWSQPVTIVSNPVAPDVVFLVSTQQNALDTLQVEDISDPKPDSVDWNFAPTTLLLGSDSAGPLIRYSQAGTYPATELAWYGGCVFSVTQDILIQPFDTNSTSPPVVAGLSFDTVTIAPNPNAGIFNLHVQLYKAQHLGMTITSIAGQLVLAKEWDGQQVVSEQVTLPSSVVSGVYVIELVTDTEVRDYNIIVAK